MSKHKVIYAKCPFCRAEQPWAKFAANNQFSTGEEKCICMSCGKKMIITATEIMRFSAKKIKEAIK